MKILHLADLHLGKKVNGFNMIEDQAAAMKEIVRLVEKEKVQVVLIAGDIYDQPLASSEAMQVFDVFLTSLRKIKVKILMIAGNHDSVERLSFASSLMTNSEIYISKPFNNFVEKVVFEDEFGEINFYLMPFLKPIHVRVFHEDVKIDDFQKAIDLVVAGIDLDESKRNVILSHQFIVGADQSDSEELYLGGSEAISIDTYDKFDYVALGHIHKKQAFRDGKVRYPGSLLKYSKSEANYQKAITILDIKEKGNIEIFERNINYLRDMRIIEGYFEDIIENSKKDKRKEDFIHINLFDEDQVFDALSRLRDIYPNLMSLVYTKVMESQSIQDIEINHEKKKNPFELFKDFYEYRKNKKLDDDKEALVKEIINDVWGNYED